jgi:hypothetical protein
MISSSCVDDTVTLQRCNRRERERRFGGKAQVPRGGLWNAEEDVGAGSKHTLLKGHASLATSVPPKLYSSLE